MAITDDVQLEQHKNWEKVKIYHSQYTGNNRGEGQFQTELVQVVNGVRNRWICGFSNKRQNKIFGRKCNKMRAQMQNIEEKADEGDHKVW